MSAYGLPTAEHTPSEAEESDPLGLSDWNPATSGFQYQGYGGIGSTKEISTFHPVAHAIDHPVAQPVNAKPKI